MAEAAPGTTYRFGPYTVQDKLGGGGMAVVYKALNEDTGATVALKVLRASLAEQAGVVERFKQEAMIVNKLRHPHVVAVNSYGTLKGRFYLEMQYMPGGTLAQRFKRPVEMTAQEAVRLLRHVGSALDYAHRQGVVHRDLKLENILLDRRSDAALSDFGIARIVDGTRLTATGGVVGTPLYISPEQARGEIRLDHRADLYSLAVIAYVLLVGHFPFNSSNMLAILNQHISEPAPIPSQINQNLPKALDIVLLRGLAKRPEERYPSADMLVEAIARAYIDYQPRNTVIDLWSDHAGKPLVVENPTPAGKSADDWVREAEATQNRQEAIACLRRALELEPLHSRANRLLFQLEGAKSLRSPAPEAPAVTPARLEELAPLKKVNRQRKRGAWFYVSLFGFALLSLASAFFILNVVGSPIASQIAGIFSGERPISEIGGTPVQDVPNAVFTVQPSRAKPIRRGTPISDTLLPGYAHEYIFDATPGEEVAIGVQFFSPTAARVGKNVAILNPTGEDSSGRCERDVILEGDSGVAFVCRINQSGGWKIRLLGIEGESTGAYVITLERF